MAVNKTLSLLASKLDLCDKEKVVSKAAEFERLLQSKLVAGSNLTDTAKVVICLDLAATFYGVSVDLKTAVKYSGLKLPTYTNSRKTIENLLEINSEKLSVSSLCLTLQCTSVEGLAEKMLKEYESKSKMELDLNLPQYVCMAVYHACRMNKVKISKSKIIEKSRLKLAQWSKLEADWIKYVSGDVVLSVKKRGRPSKVAKVEDGASDDIMEIDSECNGGKENEKTEIEPYEDWKRRMLDMAIKEFNNVQCKEKLLTRKSPRKTPQKFSPYKENPNKGKGVRLLFKL